MRSIFLFLCVISLQFTYAQEFANGIDISKSVGGLSDIFAADLDGDGDSDLLSSSAGDSKIAWYENDGTGTYSDQKIISVQLQGASAVSAADLDGDGDQDVIAVSGDISDKVVWFENQGGGVFGPIIIIDVQVYESRDVLAADLDNDGDLDIAVAHNNSVRWYTNNGSGGFGDFHTVTYDTDDVRSIAVSDLDGDGDLDLLSASYDDDKIAWYENDGTGEFGAQQMVGLLFNADDVVSADMDGDGDEDVIASSYYSSLSGSVVMFENYGNGSYSGQQIIPNDGNPTYGLIATDLDDDGDLDILSAQWYGHAIAWHENDGSANFSTQQNLVTDLNTPMVVVALDADGDGDMDVVGASNFQERIVMYSNDGEQSFSEQEVFASDVPGPKSIAVGDLNGDLTPDIVTQSQSSHKVIWYPNMGNGVYGEAVVLSADLYSPSIVEIHDMDMDGDNDVVIAQLNWDLVQWIENDGSGNFGEVITIAEMDFPHNFKIGDMDLDGDPDIMAHGNGMTAWYENNGAGEFMLSQSLNTGLSQQSNIELSDLDGDSDLDLAISSAFDDIVVWYRNIGEGIFGPQNVVAEGLDQARGIISADIDGDGDQDLLVSSYQDSQTTVHWSANDGDGTFGPPVSIASASSNGSIFDISDLDLDGDTDILVFGTGFSDDSWLENDGTGNFLSPTYFSNGKTSVSDIAALDMDGDNDVDIVVSSYQSRIIWFENTEGDGCTDAEACNYAPDAFIDNGTCCYSDCGCFNPSASNYDPDATCETGLCDFQVLGTIFHDENSNSIQDGNEYGLAGQEVLLLPDSLILTTNDQGQLNTEAVGSDQYTFILLPDELFPIHTTPDSLTFSSAEEYWSQQLTFGLSANELLYELEVEAYAEGEFHLCNAPRLHNICFQNLGNVPINGIVEMHYDTLYQGYEAITPIDSVLDNRLFMSFDTLLPGEHLCYDLYLQTPTVENIGEFTTSIARVYGHSEGTQVSYGESVLEMEVTCAYDPNDKQVFPAGYSEAHFIAENEHLEYLIRFQNTGNATATDVIIRDTLDPGLDLSSFHLLANSHSVFTTIDPASREIEFYFQDIQLPDSISDEAGSHGLVSFRIEQSPGLPLLTELNNTAFIFFDNNPPIVTNTTWGVVYDCSLFEVDITQDGSVLSSTEADMYQWYLNGEPLTGATEQTYAVLLPGGYAVEVTTDFPCVKTSPLLTISAEDIPEGALNNAGGSPMIMAPNPMTVSAVIEVKGLMDDFLLEIIDVEGRSIRSERRTAVKQQFTLERGALRPGKYVMRLTDEAGVHTLLFVVK